MQSTLDRRTLLRRAVPGAASLILAFGLSAFAAVPATVAKIVNLDTSGPSPKIEIENTGIKPISAIALKRLIPPYQGFLATEEYEPQAADIQPGQTRAIGLGGLGVGLDAEHIASQIEIASLIFGDGTHLGSVSNPAYGGIDFHDQVFEKRRGVADEAEKWAKFVTALPTNDHQAIVQFQAAAAKIAPVTVENAYTLGENEVQRGMQSIATEQIPYLEAHGYSEHWVRAHLIDKRIEGAKAAREMATEVTQ